LITGVTTSTGTFPADSIRAFQSLPMDTRA
jgi:hypothetical protein